MRKSWEIRNKVRRITKKIWKKCKLYLMVELLVLITLVISVYAMYKMTYEFEHKEASNVVEDVNRSIYNNERYELLSASEFIGVHKSMIYGTLIYENFSDKYTGYAYNLELYNKNYEVLGSLKSNEWIMTVPGNEAEEDYRWKSFNLNKYFSEEEVKKFEEFNDKCREQDEKENGTSVDGYKVHEYACIKKVTGYYDNREFVPVEIEFTYDLDQDAENPIDNITIRNDKATSDINIESINMQVWDNSIDSEAYAIVEPALQTKESNIKKLDYFINVYEENPDEPIADYGVYDYWEYKGAIDTDWEYKEDVSGSFEDIVVAEDNVVCLYKFSVCVNLHYMTITNTDFQKNTKGAFLLFHLIGILVIMVLNKYEKRGKFFDSMKYTFINAMAHEMKTPAAVLVNSAECIEEEIHPEKQTEYLNKIKKESLHINRLLLDMLEYNKLSSAENKLVKEKINARELIEEVLDHYQDSIENKNIDLQWDIKFDDVFRADRRLMEMVIDNYLSNAVKYCGNGGIIKITVDKGKIAVYNNGENIHPAKINIIWEPLYVVDESRKRREGSSGMGLAISAKILELHGFEYKAENKKVGVEFSIITK